MKQYKKSKDLIPHVARTVGLLLRDEELEEYLSFKDALNIPSTQLFLACLYKGGVIKSSRAELAAIAMDRRKELKNE